MVKLIIEGATMEDLLDKIQDRIRAELNSNEKNSSQTLDILTADQAALLINKSKATLYALTSQRKIPFSKRGNTLYFSRRDLLAWIMSGRKKTVTEI